MINNTNSNNYKEYKNKPKIVKNFVNKKNISKKEINTKNNAKKLLTKQQKQKTLSKKPSINKQQNLVKKEKEKEKEKEIIYMKIKEIHKTYITRMKSEIKNNLFQTKMVLDFQKIKHDIINFIQLFTNDVQSSI